MYNNNQYPLKMNITQVFHSLFSIFFSLSLLACKGNNVNSGGKEDIQHVKVNYEEGKYGGWPANWGIWSWDNEILVSFTKADHKIQPSHTFDVYTAINMFARSLDGGLTWKLQDSYDSGITGSTFEHNIGELSEPSISLPNDINFMDPDFAFTFRAHTLRDGPTSFYYSYDRGNNWNGPYKLEVDFPDHAWQIEQPRQVDFSYREAIAGIVSRTDYIVDGEKEMTAFLTVGFRDGDKNWREVAAVRTKDGGKTWKHLFWLGGQGTNLIMPTSARLNSSRIITTTRHTSPPRIVSYLTEDNGMSWIQLDDPVKVDVNSSPPALLRLHDGRLCLIYHIRRQFTLPDGNGIYAVFSTDEGKSWSKPDLIRGKDGANRDIGYPRAVQLSNGNVVAVYYYNNANDENSTPYRYIAATIFNPDKY
jgi:hypothetical protein